MKNAVALKAERRNECREAMRVQRSVGECSAVVASKQTINQSNVNGALNSGCGGERGKDRPTKRAGVVKKKVFRGQELVGFFRERRFRWPRTTKGTSGEGR